MPRRFLLGSYFSRLARYPKLCIVGGCNVFIIARLVPRNTLCKVDIVWWLLEVDAHGAGGVVN